MSHVTVLTPTVHSRRHLIADAISSVEAQTRQPLHHWIGYDHERRGAAAMLNQLQRAVCTAYVMVLDDDDVLYPDHIEVCAGVLDRRPEIDVVSTWCDSEGRREFTHYNVDRFSADTLMSRCNVAHTSMFRARWLQTQPWESGRTDYDWRFWKALHHRGARFHVERKITWNYRLLGNNVSHGENP